jgi:trehalose-6-phosphate synthase
VEIRAELGGQKTLLVGIDRLDYTKGIEQRPHAYGEILANDDTVRGSLAFVQIGTLTRERVARYANLRERVERLAGHLNRAYGRVSVSRGVLVLSEFADAATELTDAILVNRSTATGCATRSPARSE